MKVLEGKLVAGKGKFAIVASRFNEFIVSKLISGAEDTLVRHGVDTDDITLVWVPGAFEIPLAALKLAQSGKYCAVLCLGAVIRGSTSHYDYVCNEVSKGVAQVNLQTGVPTTFGVLTTENIEQAIERAGTKAGNKGADAAFAPLDLANLIPQLCSGPHCEYKKGLAVCNLQTASPFSLFLFYQKKQDQIFCKYRIRTTATSARVALPAGLRVVSLLPDISPSDTAQASIGCA
mgnify:CR=1 FL=1